MIFHESRDNGWIQYRRNLVCHVEDGRMDGHDFMVLSMLLLLADSNDGTLKTCAGALVKLLHCGLDERGIQRILDRLDKRDYLRRDIVTGRRGLYQVTINKYAITTGPNTGKRSEIPVRIEPKTAQKRGPEDGVSTQGASTEVVSDHGVKMVQRSSPESAGSSILATVPCGEDGLKTDPSRAQVGSDPATIQQRDLKQTQETEKETAVVGGGGRNPTPEEDDDIPFYDCLERETHDGNYSSAIPVETGTGQSDGTNLSDEDDPDSPSAHLGSSPEPEYLPFNNPVEQSHNEQSPPESRGAAAEFAEFYFNLIGSPSAFREMKNWEAIASAMLKDNSLDDIRGAAEYALSHHFWQPKMLRFDRDPFLYLQKALLELLKQYGGVKNARTFNDQHNKKSEPHHGRKSPARKTKQQLLEEGNDAVSDRVLRKLGIE
jgi:hypothetical protein